MNADTASTAAALFIAHRGWGENGKGSEENPLPENTLPAFERAFQQGIPVELDLRVSSDRQIVSIHDADTIRTTGHSGQVGEMTLAELKSLNAGHGFDRRAEIPRLEEILDLMRVYPKAHVIFDVKGRSVDIANTLWSVLKRYPDLFPRIAVVSYNHHRIIWRFRTLTKRQIRTAASRAEIAGFQRVSKSLATRTFWRWWSFDLLLVPPTIEIASCKVELISPSLITIAEASQIEVYPWTVNNPEAARELFLCGAERLITDVPLELANALHAAR